MQTQFKSERSNLPTLCLMPSVAFHDNNKPSVPILKRVIQLAKEALNYLEINNSDSIKVRRYLNTPRFTNLTTDPVSSVARNFL